MLSQAPPPTIMNTIEEKPVLPPLAHIMNVPLTQLHHCPPLMVSVDQPETPMKNPAKRTTVAQSPIKRTPKCTCKQDGTHIPRPRNAFILFRQQHHQSVLDEGNVIKTNPDVSRELGRRWRDLAPKEKEHWNLLAEEEKKRHAEKYPGYRYVPRRFGKKGSCPHCKAKSGTGTKSTSLAGSASPPNSLSPVSPQSEEHAIAKSFLSLRTPQQHHHHHHHHHRHHPQQYQHFPQQHQDPQQPQQHHQPLPYPQRHSHDQHQHQLQHSYQHQRQIFPPAQVFRPLRVKLPSLAPQSPNMPFPKSSLASLLN